MVRTLAGTDLSGPAKSPSASSVASRKIITASAVPSGSGFANIIAWRRCQGRISTVMIAPPLLLSKREGRARLALYEATCKIGNTGRHCAKRVPVPSACLIVLTALPALIGHPKVMLTVANRFA
jgi:hypothetical protein